MTLFLISVVFPSNNIKDSLDPNENIKNNNIIDVNEVVKPKNAVLWDENDVRFIHIKNDNWSATKLPWIQNKTGAWDDPHVIENVSISGKGEQYGILIEDSSQYFIIRNCTITHCGSASTNMGGINLKNAHNGTLINNTCSNNYKGIYLGSSDNNNIVENNVNSNIEVGIQIQTGSNYNNISGNILNNNEYYGIQCWADNNNITGNQFYDNGQVGISLSFCESINLTENVMNDDGISILGSLAESSSHKIDKTNLVNGKPVYYYVNEKGLKPNDFTDSGIAGQIILVNCSYSLISDLNITHTSTGVALHYSDNNTISYINASHNSESGLSLKNCNNITISENIVNYNVYENLLATIDTGNGIYIYDCNDINVSKNTVTDNAFGISLRTVSDSVITNNSINNNAYGINVYGCNYVNITKNNVNNNEDGIVAIKRPSDDCINNILQNTLNNNKQHGISLVYSSPIGSPTGAFSYTLQNNIMSGCGISIEGTDVIIPTHNIDTTNLVNGKPVYYYANEDGLKPNNFTDSGIAGQILLLNCDDTSISNLNCSYASRGIALHTCENITVSNNNASYNRESGIFLENCNDINVSGNIASYNRYGIFFSKECTDINFTENKMDKCGIFYRWQTYSISGLSSFIIDTTNLVNGKPVYFYKNEIGLTPNNFIDAGNAGQIILVNCSYSLISDLDVSYGSLGLSLLYCENNTILNVNSSYNTKWGLLVFKGNNNSISQSNFNYNRDWGIYLEGCFNTTISNSKIANNGFDFSSLRGGGIVLVNYPENTIITGNSITNNTKSGLNGLMSKSGLFYNNTFSNNGVNGFDSSYYTNKWDNGFIGNMWDDYSGVDADDDGIGDTIYYITGNNNGFDNFPISIDGIDLQGGVIFIDDISTNNWVWAVDRYWCSGSGTQSDPYIIKDLIINGYESDVCIEIKNSDVYFRIENCKVYNSSNGIFDAGIRLDNAHNGTLINNNCSFNNKDGIRIAFSNNTRIIGNIANNNTGSGIILEFSNNSIISGNTVKYNTLGGIVLNCSTNNTISGNRETINNNGLYGIYLDSSNNNDILDNIINNNPIGIYLDSSNNTYVADNDLLGNGEAIVEINCIGNVFSNNILPSGVLSPGGEDDNGGGDDDDEGVIPGYDLYLLTGIISLISVVIIFMKRKRIKTT